MQTDKYCAIYILIFLSVLTFSAPVLADDFLNVSPPGANEKDQHAYFLTSPDYWGGYFSDTFGLLSSPLNWNTSGRLTASAITGITIILYQNDPLIQKWAMENRNETTNAIAGFAGPFGDGRYSLIPLSLLYGYGCWKDDLRARRAALLSIESYAITGLFTGILKLSGHRHRPSTGDPYNTWDGPGIYFTNLSFPSGHSSSAFAVATVIAEEYGEYPLVPVIAYSIAGLTAWSRVNDNHHWASDVFFGSALGYFTAKAVVERHKGERARAQASKLTLFPVFNDGNIGLKLGYGF